MRKGVVPDVIITDNEMPEIDGATLLRQLRCSGLWSGIPVVVMGEVEDTDKEAARFKSLGAQDFFNKPFSPVALQETLLKILGAS